MRTIISLQTVNEKNLATRNSSPKFHSKIIIIVRRHKKNLGTTESRTRIVGFRVQSDNHYTIAPVIV